ncbi:hypothetical protein BT67DRAFT_457896 [Trichocladium antarcticum]|uniref:Uncharacterized protein n=1 Tax=Trichocladium antarcticum TaxID=1450529 RepID=A0AAN6UEW2_9PEZI|nr:hypothetical protein BT67DRAFT_457896 [Trichocladium antarcticum]
MASSSNNRGLSAPGDSILDPTPVKVTVINPLSASDRGLAASRWAPTAATPSTKPELESPAAAACRRSVLDPTPVKVTVINPLPPGENGLAASRWSSLAADVVPTRAVFASRPKQGMTRPVTASRPKQWTAPPQNRSSPLAHHCSDPTPVKVARRGAQPDTSLRPKVSRYHGGLLQRAQPDTSLRPKVSRYHGGLFNGWLE